MANTSTARSRETRSPASVQSVCSLDTWIRYQWDDGVGLEGLPPLQRIRIWTRNSVYDIITGSEAGDVRVRGGRVFPDWTPAHLAGSSVGGNFLKQRSIHVGLRLEFQAGQRRVTTSPIEAVAILEDPAAI